MMAALPAAAPAKPAKARKVLVLGNARGFVHSSIPLAAKTIEELGKKTGAWTTTITYDPADINTKNLEQYDALFLVEHDRLLPRREDDRAAGEQGGSRSAAGGVHRVRARRQGRRRHSRDRRLVSQPVRQRSGRRRRPRRRRSAAAAPTTPGGTLASVILRWSWGLDDKKLQDERPDADQGRHGSRQRRDVRAARPREGRQGLPGQLHHPHRPARDADRTSTSARPAATPARARGRTGTT